MPTSPIKGNHPAQGENPDGSTPSLEKLEAPNTSPQQPNADSSVGVPQTSNAPSVTGETDSKRRRWSSGLSIRAKVALILVVPIIAILAFAGLRINDSRSAAQQAEEVNLLAKVGERISPLVHQLQEERSRASTILTAGIPAGAAGLREQGSITDEAAEDLKDLVQHIDLDTQKSVNQHIDRAMTDLESLPELRRKVLNGQVSPDEAVTRYTAVIFDILSVTEEVARTTDNPKISASLNTLTSFAWYKEFAAQETYILYTAIHKGRFEPGQYRNFANTLAKQEVHLLRFNQYASAGQRTQLEQLMPRDQVARVVELENAAIQGETANNLKINEQSWLNATSKRATLMQNVEQKLTTDVIAISDRLRSQALQTSISEGGLVLLVLVAAVTVSLFIARSMVQPLARLRSSALEVAYENLPDVVRRLRGIESVNPSDITAIQAAASRTTHEIDMRSTDEIGQVAQAFNAIHQEAVRVATEQAELRLSVAAMFVNLARRSQLLVDRLIRLIDTLEQGERDPDRLAELFRLDHLATRMRRNDENLLVLAGAEGGRRWSQTAPLIDVIRAAVAEVEQYTRIKIGNVDEVEISAKAVNDIVHLIAELLENAASFSSPRTEVLADARVVHDQVVIEIEDQGIGMSREQLTELNERLAKPPVLDVAVSRMMGLFVVGRLAARHGVRVMLRPATGGGTVAIVTLPAGTLTETSVPEQVHAEQAANSDNPPAPATPQSAAQLPVRAALPPGNSTAPLPNVVNAAQTEGYPGWEQQEFGGPIVPPPRDGAEHSGEFSAIQTNAPQPSSSGSVAPINPPLPHRVTTPPESSTNPPADSHQQTNIPTRPPATSASVTRQWRYHEAAPADPTVEMPLPIFESLDSEWFRPPKAASDTATDIPSINQPGAEPHTMEPVAIDESLLNSGVIQSSQEIAETVIQRPKVVEEPVVIPQQISSTSDFSTDDSDTLWSTVADAGWKRAQAVAEPKVSDITASGLPKRVPMANFVPGSAEQAMQRPSSPQRPPAARDPENVRGLLANYRQGVEKGRLVGRSGRSAVVTDSDDQRGSSYVPQEEK